MAWFEINGNHIISNDYNPWSENNGAVWGLYIGGVINCTHNGERHLYTTCHEYREMSINKILGALFIHENVYIEKFREPIELDIDDMIESLIQFFETAK